MKWKIWEVEKDDYKLDDAIIDFYLSVGLSKKMASSKELFLNLKEKLNKILDEYKHLEEG